MSCLPSPLPDEGEAEGLRRRGPSAVAAAGPCDDGAVRTTLIVNPYASRVTPELADQVARELGAVEILFTERAGHASELARNAETEAVVVYSGDGGFNEALNGAQPETLLGFVPGGGTSVLPRALQRVVTSSPSAICSSIVRRRSGKASR